MHILITALVEGQYTSIQICNYSSMQVCKYADMLKENKDDPSLIIIQFSKKGEEMNETTSNHAKLILHYANSLYDVRLYCPYCLMQPSI